MVIRGAGLHIGGDGKDQIRMTGSMIAMTDNAWETAKLAIGRFASPEVGEYWGVNAEVIGGKLIVGNNLIIENATDTGVMQFKVDATGAWLNNSTMVFQQDGGGKILMDPKYGIVAGTGSLFDTDGTTIKPGFIDSDGNIILDKDGMPEGSNFFLDLRDGTAYFRGKVYAEEGRFRGDVYADNFYFNDGDDVRTLINDAGEVDFSKMKKIDLGGIVLDGETGNINFTGAGSITWGDNAPVKYQFSTSLSGPWHDTMEANDKYRRDSLDGGTTWGSPYQFKGTDGRNGSDANVPKYIKETYIDSVEIRSPTIKANDYYIYPYDESDYDGTFNIFGMWNGKQYHMFQVAYYGSGDYPMIRICSPGGGYMYLGKSGGELRVEGYLDLTNVSGIEWGNNAPRAVFA